MSLKTRLRISIVALVTIVVVALAMLYLYDFSTLALEAAQSRCDLVGRQVLGYVQERIGEESARRNLHPGNVDEASVLWTDIVRGDPAVKAMLTRTLGNSQPLVDVHIASASGEVLVSAGPPVSNETPRVDLAAVRRRNAFLGLLDVLTRNEYYTTTLPLSAEPQHKLIFQVGVVVQSSLLKDTLQPALRDIAWAFAIALACAIGLAFALPSVVLNPLSRLSQRIDLIRTGDPDASQQERRETREFAAVQSKLNLLGDQFRGARQDALQLRRNIEELLQRLEEAVLLFDVSGRLTMAGIPAERLLGRSKDEMLGRRIDEVFPESTALGAVIQKAVLYGKPVHDQLVGVNGSGPGKGRLLLNVEILRNSEGHQGMGTMVTLHDADSRQQLEMQLDVSSRLAAISRLTGGVAHEIKNPLNAMTLHLEVLKSKLEPGDPEIDVISKEIQRLDNVVKTFLNFNRPVAVQAKPFDLSALAAELIGLIGLEAKHKGIRIETRLEEPQWINGDEQLLQQAVLNVVMNSIEAMSPGGQLVIETGCTDTERFIRVTDDGAGIPPEIQDKIFNLYFSTKKTGSGIGLAMTFRSVQLHSGSIVFSSEPGEGTSFVMRFPALTALDGGRALGNARA